MIFEIDYTDGPENRTLIYRENEYSFDMNPWNHAIDFELTLNKITMSVIDDKVIQLSGFCGLTKEMDSNIRMPEYKKGALRLIHNLEYGFAYRICNEDLPVQLNTKTGWVCIGGANKVGRGVEFIDNCVAVVGDDGFFLSLWLKPVELPLMS
ncbi:MAG: hypothetical protein AAF363_00170 [Bacteroidota bacterium]